MRLRTFEARTMADALQQMRRALGEDAVIVASQELADRVRLTAAIDLGSDDLAGLLAPKEVTSSPTVLAGCLAYHATAPALRDALLAGAECPSAAEPAAELTRLLDKRFRFAPLTLPPPRPLALVGPTGAGKTVSVVRLAAQALVAGTAVRIASTDTVRTGGLGQLTELLRPLGLAPQAARTPEELRKIAQSLEADTALIIDTTGINPFHGGEVTALAELLRAARAEPVLVLPAGLDAEDSVELAANFAAIGTQRMIAGKIDTARRLGGLLAAADLGLAFAGASIAPAIGRGVPLLNAAGLARVLLHRAGISQDGS